MQRHCYSEDHEAFRASVREFLRREVIPHVDDHADGRQIPRAVWLAAGTAGYLGLEVPEEHGGSEAGDYRYNAVLLEELAKVNASAAW